MFVFSARLSRKRLVCGALAVAAVLVGASVLGGVFRRGEAAAAAVSTPNPKGIRSDQDRLDYLSEFGWLVAEEPLAVEDLRIPEEMGTEYDDYLALQSAQGFDLAKYAGKYVKRYTYEILNYPTGEEGVQISLLLYRHRVIAGEVLSPRLNGFLHGLAMPGQEAESGGA